VKTDIEPKPDISPESLETLAIVKYLYDLGAIEVNVNSDGVYARFAGEADERAES
jgi:hypothetical protein